MANKYVRSTDGSNADNGTTWALAKGTIVGADAVTAAGDSVWVSQVHAETGTAAVTYTSAGGTLTAPLRIVCGNDGAEPPTSAATTATLSITGAGGSLIWSGICYVYGLTLINASTTNGVVFNLGGAHQVWEQCSFQFGHASNTAGTMRLVQGDGFTVKLRNCTVKFAGTGQSLWIGGSLHWNGGSAVSGTATPVTLFGTYFSGGTGCTGPVLIENVDFSNFATTLILSLPPPPQFSVTIRNCKLPASWVGGLIGTAFTTPGRIEMYNCDSGSTNYKLWIEDFFGQIKDQTTIVRTGGASDGVTPLSWTMLSSTSAVFPQALVSPPIYIYNSTTGSSKTLTVEIIHDSVTNLTDREVWLDVSYLGASGTPLGTPVADVTASWAATAADQSSSSVTWTTTGMTNPNKQALSVTVTPQMKGFFICRVALAKPSKGIYVDPVVTIS